MSRPQKYRVIYRSPFAGGTEISEPGTREQCMSVFTTALDRGWLRQGNGRRMIVMSDAEYRRTNAEVGTP